MTYYKTSEYISTRLFEKEGARLFNPDNNQKKYLNSTGLFIWKRLNGSFSVDDISDQMMTEYEEVKKETVIENISSFCKELLNEKYIYEMKNKKPEQNLYNYINISDAPETFDISVTRKCNLHCKYCFYDDDMKQRKDLPLEEWLLFFKELGKLAVHSVTLSGGELFVRKDLWEMIDSIIENKMRYSILSNGTLINERTIDKFQTGKRFKRLNSIQVSIDGSCAEIHDKSRDRGSFEKAIKGLTLLKDNNFPVTVRTTIDRYNVNDLDNIARLLLEDIRLPSFGTNDAMPMGAGCFNQEEITLTSRQQYQAILKLAELQKKYKGRIQAQAGPLAKWYGYHEMEKAKKLGKATDKRMGFLTACGGVFNKLAVHHDGVIIPCNMLAALELGRINKDLIIDIWKNNITLKALRDRRKIPMTEVKGCEDCEWAPYCNGSCPGLAYDMTGDFNRANPHDCYRKFIEEVGHGIEAKHPTT